MTTDPWAVLVAETMAQQTQIERVGPAWTGFMTRFPTPAALADAGPAEAVRAWRGLGYNRRALNLYRSAERIVAEHEGRVPADPAELAELPGVGPYTARAVAATAHGVPVGPVDTNVRRVLTRLLAPGTVTGPDALQRAADALVPAAAAADWAHAVMDLGATVCRRTEPRCGDCPVARWCSFAVSGAVGEGRVRLAASGATGEERARVGSSERFEHTRRWLRGRIVDRLRQAPPGTWVEFEGPLGAHGPEAVEGALDGLERDGLLERRTPGSMWARLPGSTLSV